MGRPHRAAEGGYVYHVLNRANARMTIFADDGDFEAFEKVLSQAVKRSQTRLLAYCEMPNHGHLLKQWRWGNPPRWLRVSVENKELIAAWPLPRKPNWVDHVNAPQTEAELAAMRQSAYRGSPFGGHVWSGKAVRRLGLESTLRPQGRPKKPRNGS